MQTTHPTGAVDSILFEPAQDRKTPRHHFFSEDEQYRLKVQRFSRAPCEVTVQRISFEADQARYRRAAENGFTRVSNTRKLRDPDRTPDAESVDRSQRRAKTAVRLRVTELAPHSLVTFTTRAVFDLDELADRWKTDKIIEAEKSPPSMNTSPCAKLISSRMP